MYVHAGPYGRPLVTDSPVYRDQAELQTRQLRLLNERRMRLRQSVRKTRPNYFILVPTLRCNIRCDYCQVSRVAEHAKGFDWDESLAEQILTFVLEASAPEVTLEFQGGEPLLRLDIIEMFRARMIAAGKSVKIVICTNLQTVSDAAWSFLQKTDVLISSSFDGTWAAHDQLRTQDAKKLEDFRGNLVRALQEFGNDRVSLVSTLDPLDPPPASEIIRSARELGISGLFLRPINYQGFARKAFRDAKEDQRWDRYYLDFIDTLIAHNLQSDTILGEYYFGYILRRILDPRRGEHVDLRNPSWLAHDYLVIDEKGAIFPTDEARMLFRTGQIDLRVGHAAMGLDHEVVDQLNVHADNRSDPDCATCVYQSVCGRDLVDDLSRYGRIDGSRHDTRHCQRHLSIFDHVMRKLASAPEDELHIMGRMAGLSSLDASVYRVHHG
ncbi:radical SAM protein [Falsirhodobacter sp. 1013]|uniref:radical SAM protein n=1 Tax=Falsirhodobacter sp. 1013 TaxID=3417566 RepID=UPI003EBCA3A6